MGLLEKISKLKPTDKKNGNGLLAHAISIRTVCRPASDFWGIVSGCGFTSACILSRLNSKFYITVSKNLMARSIVSSVSEKDFWQPLLTDKGVWHQYLLEKGEFAPYYQIFTQDFLCTQSKMYLLAFTCNEEQYIFAGFLSKQSEEDTLSIDQKAFTLTLCEYLKKYQLSLDSTENEKETADLDEAQKLTISLTSICDKLTQTLSDIEIRDAVKESIAFNFFNAIRILFAKPNKALYNKEKIDLLIFSKAQLDIDLLKFMILQNCDGIFSEQMCGDDFLLQD